MRKIVILLLFVFLSVTVVFAAPLPQRPVVNHQTHECAMITPGDECGDVVLPPGWEYLDEAAGETCPVGYTTIELYPEWTKFKAPHCCMEGHSGVAGDCQDVIIEQSRKQCAFVEDIQSCVGLPEGWEAWGKDCPQGFEWVDDMVCTVSETISTPTVLPQTETIPTLTKPGSESGGMIGTLEPTETTDQPKNLLPCPSVAIITMSLAGVGYLFRRRNQY